jgi:hypothetical protein
MEDPHAAATSAIPLEALVDALSPYLISTASRISARLGYRRDDDAAVGLGCLRSYDDTGARVNEALSGGRRVICRRWP